ncbi:FAD-dependent oxidoreductase [Paracoccus sp. P2]|uniref:FAD-dependent oxidoreductase n=1 Tax=Paracoccus sp. P2 TaxID=3248840 RepID=UPI00391F9476
MTTHDVIVVGGGPGGLAAAYSAAKAGARVAILETQDHLGGNAILSTGHLVLIDTPVQRRNGIKDSIELFMEDAERQFEREKTKGGLIWDRELTLRFATESRATYDEITELGIEIARLDSKPSQHSADRLHTLKDPTAIGRAYGERLAALGAGIFLRAEVDDLITSDGRVTGLTARQTMPDGSVQQLALAASRGVILATGGYQGNFELRRRYQPEEAINKHIVGVNTCRGAGHVLGASVGGDLINMAYIQPMVLVPTRLVQDAVAVNLSGTRFHDETGPYAGRVESLAQQPEQTAYYIVDSETLERRADFVGRMPEKAIIRDTLTKLGAAIGCDVAQLQDSIRDWNAFLGGSESKDPVTGRVLLPVDRRTISKPPFAALRMVRGISFTWGGLTTTLDMQVVTVQGRPVPGLFAVGDTVGGINVLAGMGGLHISPAITMGRIAGIAAVRGAEAKPHIVAPSQSGTFEPSKPLKFVLFDLEERAQP